ncbi:hypothetical protein [Demequina salsinemoris]|uniref:hypothetical protein n=1 Tax=Demequina salsinemoris TaxID=577470 RepID=UPI001364CBFF|nr:hypothetical protein [Demequina salsinemoris]
MSAVTLSGCAALGTGPLDVFGPASGMCSTVDPEEAATYFGVLLDNTEGADDAILMDWRVTESTNLASIVLLFDPDGPALDQVVGSMGWPSDDTGPMDSEVMARAVDPIDGVVEAGTSGQLLLALDADDPAADVSVQEMTLTYRSGGHVHTVWVPVDFSVDADQDCEDW